MRSASIHNYGELKGVGRIVLISTLRRLFPHANEDSIKMCWAEGLPVCLGPVLLIAPITLFTR